MNGNIHVENALAALSKVATKSDGRISWESSTLERGVFQILCNINFSSDVEDHDKDQSIWHSLNECAKADNFTQRYFLRVIRSYLRSLKERPDRFFIAVAQINAEARANLPCKIMSADVPVHIQNTFPRSCRKIVNNIDDFDSNKFDFHENFVFMTARLKMASDRSAVDAAHRSIQFALGIMNLSTRGYGVSKRFGFPNAPIGKFLLASPVSIFDQDENRLGNWYSESHYPSRWKKNFSVIQKQDTESIKKFAKKFVSDMQRVDFKERVIQSVLMFQEGLESLHIDIALLKFWTGIELLCGKDDREPTARIIERASSVFDDYRYAAMRLNFIQEYRNKVVHRGESGDHALLCAQYASAYLGALIRFFLWNKYKFRKRDVLLEFLSLPLDAQKLEGSVILNRTRLAALKRMTERTASKVD